MITASFICETTETCISIDPKCLRLIQIGDVVKWSFAINEEAFGHLSPLVDDDSVVLYRNTVWLKFTVKRREFFMLHHTDDKTPQTGAIFAEPTTANALKCLKYLEGGNKTKRVA
jgi:hypothetical protein